MILHNETPFLFVYNSDIQQWILRSWYSDTNTKCPLNISSPRISAPQKVLTNLYKPRAYIQDFTVFYYIELFSKGLEGMSHWRLGVPLIVLLLLFFSRNTPAFRLKSSCGVNRWYGNGSKNLISGFPSEDCSSPCLS